MHAIQPRVTSKLFLQLLGNRLLWLQPLLVEQVLARISGQFTVVIPADYRVMLAAAYPADIFLCLNPGVCQIIKQFRDSTGGTLSPVEDH